MTARPAIPTIEAILSKMSLLNLSAKIPEGKTKTVIVNPIAKEVHPTTMFDLFAKK